MSNDPESIATRATALADAIPPSPPDIAPPPPEIAPQLPSIPTGAVPPMPGDGANIAFPIIDITGGLTAPTSTSNPAIDAGALLGILTHTFTQLCGTATAQMPSGFGEMLGAKLATAVPTMGSPVSATPSGPPASGPPDLGALLGIVQAFSNLRDAVSPPPPSAPGTSGNSIAQPPSQPSLVNDPGAANAPWLDPNLAASNASVPAFGVGPGTALDLGSIGLRDLLPGIGNMAGTAGAAPADTAGYGNGNSDIWTAYLSGTAMPGGFTGSGGEDVHL